MTGGSENGAGSLAETTFVAMGNLVIVLVYGHLDNYFQVQYGQCQAGRFYSLLFVVHKINQFLKIINPLYLAG